MPIEAMIRTPKDTPTATPILIPSLDSEDALLVTLDGGPAIGGVLVEKGSVDVDKVSVDDSEDIDEGDTVSVTVSVCVSVSFVDFVAVTVTMLCELALIALDR